MMRAETADRSFSRPDSFLRQSMASMRNGSRSLRTRSASERVKSRWGGSGVSSCSGSSSAIGMLRLDSFVKKTAQTKSLPEFDALQEETDCNCHRFGLAQSQHAVESKPRVVTRAFIHGDAIHNVAGTEVLQRPEEMLRSNAEHSGADTNV